MKFVCEQCERTTEAASVRLEGGAAVLVCQHCGFDNRLDTGEAPPKDVAAEAAEAAEAGEAEPAAGIEEFDSAEEPAAAEEAGPGEEAGSGEAEESVEEDEPVEEAEAVQAVQAIAALTGVKCPKCFHRQQGGTNCERCGLDLSRAADLAQHWDAVPEVDDEVVEEARRLWREVEQSHQKKQAHEVFLAHCSDHQLLDFAVRRYRSRLADRPGEEPTETFMSKAVTRLETVALSMLTARRWSEDLARQVRTAKRILFIVAAILVLVGLVLLVLMYRKQGSLLPSAL